MIARLGLKFTAAAVIAAAAALCVLSLGFALYAALEPLMTRAGAAACVALAAALVALIVGLITFRMGGGWRREPAPGSGSLIDRLVFLARERPVVTGVAAVAAGWILLRNPALATMVAAALSERNRDRRR